MVDFGEKAAIAVKDSAKTSADEASRALSDEFCKASADKTVNQDAFREEMEEKLKDVLPALSIGSFKNENFVTKYDKEGGENGGGDGALSEKELRQAAASKDTPQADKLMIKQLLAQYEALKAQNKNDSQDKQSNANGITNADIDTYLARNPSSAALLTNDTVIMDFTAFKQTLKNGEVVAVEFPGHRRFVLEEGKWVAKNDANETIQDCKVERKKDGTFVVESNGVREEYRPDGSVVTMKVEKWGAKDREREFLDPAENGSAKYKVKSGDTLWAIAKDVVRHRTGKANPSNAEIQKAVDEIYAANKDKLKDANRIHPDQELTIPAENKSDSQDKPQVGKTETVQADSTKRTVERDVDGKVTVTEEKDGCKVTYQKIGDKVYKSINGGEAVAVEATVEVSADNNTVTIVEGKNRRTTFANGTKMERDETGKITVTAKDSGGNVVTYVRAPDNSWTKDGAPWTGAVEVKDDGTVVEKSTSADSKQSTTADASKPVGEAEAKKEAAVLSKYFKQIASLDVKGYNDCITPAEIDEFLKNPPKDCTPEEIETLKRAKAHLGRIQGVYDDECGDENDGATEKDLDGFAAREKKFEQMRKAKAYLEENFDNIAGKGASSIMGSDFDAYVTKRKSEGADPEELEILKTARTIVKDWLPKKNLKKLEIVVDEEKYDEYTDNSPINRP